MPNLGQVLFTLGNMNNQAYQSQLQQQNLAANQQSLADNALRMQAYQDQQAALGAYGKNFINALTAQTPQGMTAPMPTTPPPQPGQASVPMVQPTNVESSKAPPVPTNGLAPVQPVAGAMQQAGNLAGTPTVAKGLSQAPSSAGQQGAPQPPQTPDALTGSILDADPTQPIPNPSLQLLSQTLNGPLKPVMDALQKAGQERPQDDPILHASMTAWQKYLSDNPNATPGQLAAFTSVALPQTMDLLKNYSAQTRIPLNSLLTFGGTLAHAVQTANTAQLGNQVKIATTDQNNAMRQYVSDNSLKAAQLRSQAQVQAAQTRAGGTGADGQPIPFADAVFQALNSSKYGKQSAQARQAMVDGARKLGIPLPAVQESMSLAQTSNRALADLQTRSSLIQANEGAIQQQATIAMQAAKNLGLTGPVSFNAGKLYIGKKLVPTDSPIYQEIGQYDALLKEIQREYGSISMFGKSTVWGLKSSADLINENAGAGLEGAIKGIQQGAAASVQALQNVATGLRQAPVITLIQNSKDPQKTAGELGMKYASKEDIQKLVKQYGVNPATAAMQLFLKGVYVEGMQYNAP